MSRRTSKKSNWTIPHSAQTEEAAKDALRRIVGYNVFQLKELMKPVSLPLNGSKEMLLTRIYEHIAGHPAENLFHHNPGLKDVFNQLADQKKTEPFIERSLRNIAFIVDHFPEPITRSQQLVNTKGVGKGSSALIEEYLTTGTVSRLHPSEEKSDESTPLEWLKKQPDSVTLSEWSQAVLIPEEELRSLLATWLESGQVYTTFDEDHFQSVH